MSDDLAKKEELIKLRMRVVCICKGIKMGRFLDVIDTCDTVEQVNSKVGSGSGGCKGHRCGPKIEDILADKET